MKKIQDLLFDLEKKVESSLAELSKLKNEKNDLLDKNQILINEKNELNAEFRLLMVVTEKHYISNMIMVNHLFMHISKSILLKLKKL